jgi:hypothetical protein
MKKTEAKKSRATVPLINVNSNKALQRKRVEIATVEWIAAGKCS